ncbi:MAG TPA: protein kinase [Gemmatimonadales bacterium]|nr:protein kinase [Gemmatimonadales bacterium]
MADLTTDFAGRYRIERELGAGGMATVYLAQDLRHDRRVAIKVLRPELAAVIGAQRFLSEIKTTANLQHPHILPLFDSGEIVTGHGSWDMGSSPQPPTTHDSRPTTLLYYVVPYIEGESLRDLLTREKQLSVAEAVRLASEVASALDYAHRHGVIHRDIKPENILLHEGRALVADFGIALAVSRSDGATRMTETGMSLGTPHYMSPEQAMGEREITARSDIYSLGAMTYEMLVGEPPFSGPTAQSIVAKVLTAEPASIRETRKRVPEEVEEAVLTALQKLPADRFATAAEFADALAGRIATASPARRSGGVGRPIHGRWFAWAGLAVAVAALGLIAWRRFTRLAPPESRFAIALARGQDISLAMQGTHFAVSHDGSLLVYTGGDSVHGRLWVKRRNSLVATSIPGTEGAYNPFISPDDRSVGFFTDVNNGRTLAVVSLTGGPPRTVITTPLGNSGAAWATDGYIYFDADQGGLQRIRPDGTDRQTVMPLDLATHEAGIAWPQVLPGAHTVIMRLRHIDDVPADYSIVAVRIGSGQRSTLTRGVSAAYEPGHLLFVTADGTLETAPFSEKKLRITGPSAAALNDVRIAGNYSGIDLSVTDDGVLYYLAGSPGTSTRLEWVDRNGAARPVDPNWSEEGEIRGLALSPDETRAAVEISRVGSTGTDIWIKQLPAGPLSRLTLDPAPDSRPIFSSDGHSVIFLSERVTPEAVFERAANGTGNDRRFARARRNITEVTESHDGKWLIARTSSADSGSGDILAMRIGVDTMLHPIIATPAGESNPALSADGHWLAYTSNETGRREVYVRPFPNVNDGVWQISTNGGFEPLWANSGRELFFRRGTGTVDLMAVDVVTTPVFHAGAPHAIASTDAAVGLDYRRYAVSRDDRRFLMVGRADPDAQPQLVRIEHFDPTSAGRTAP